MSPSATTPRVSRITCGNAYDARRWSSAGLNPHDRPQGQPRWSPTCHPYTSRHAFFNRLYDYRVNTYRKRQAIRDQYRGQIDEAVFNAAIAAGKGLESAVKDAMAARGGSGS